MAQAPCGKGSPACLREVLCARLALSLVWVSGLGLLFAGSFGSWTLHGFRVQMVEVANLDSFEV